MFTSDNCCSKDGTIHAPSSHTIWTYEDQHAWSQIDPVCNNGSHQSPVKIDSSSLVKSHSMIYLELRNWRYPAYGHFKNNGHTVVFNPTKKLTSLKNHRGNYTLQQFHFHWGRHAGEGSEHIVHGRQYDAEIHFVHRKEGANTGVLQADTFSVVAVFCEEKDIDPYGIWEQLAMPTEYESACIISKIVYKDLLPNDLHYCYYEGSLTTPPCTEAVQWFVMTASISIPSKVLQMLRSTKGPHGNIEWNFRSVQPLNDRAVYGKYLSSLS